MVQGQVGLTPKFVDSPDRHVGPAKLGIPYAPLADTRRSFGSAQFLMFATVFGKNGDERGNADRRI